MLFVPSDGLLLAGNEVFSILLSGGVILLPEPPSFQAFQFSKFLKNGIMRNLRYHRHHFTRAIHSHWFDKGSRNTSRLLDLRIRRNSYVMIWYYILINKSFVVPLPRPYSTILKQGLSKSFNLSNGSPGRTKSLSIFYSRSFRSGVHGESPSHAAIRRRGLV